MKNIKSLFVIFSLILVFAISLFAQETESAASSNLTGVSLPANAQRVFPASVPTEITDALDKFVATGEGKITKGDTEVLLWSGTGYSKSKSQNTINSLTNFLKSDGWQYSVEGQENGVTVFSLLKEGLQRRGIVGFYGATDDALIFAWVELLSANGETNNPVNNNVSNAENTPKQNAQNSGGGGSIIGTWTNGTVSMLSETNVYTGQISSRGGSTFKYVFGADGSFESVGLINSTLYGCTTSLFNDKRGKYKISGSNIIFTPTKNYWKNTNSCSSSSNKEQNYTLEPETYAYRIKTDEYGATLICMAKPGKDEVCYQKQ